MNVIMALGEGGGTGAREGEEGSERDCGENEKYSMKCF